MLTNFFLKSFTGKKVVVTGGTGLIGRQVVDMLVEAGSLVKAVSLDRIKTNDKVKYTYGDLSSFEFCKKITKGADFVFHLAGVKGSAEVTKTKPASFFVPILMMNTNVLEACRVNKVRKVVYTSSIGAYASNDIFKETDEMNGFEGEPMDTFPGWAKRMAELQIKAYQIQYGLSNFAIVRLCNVYGPGDNFDPKNAMVIPSLMYRIYHGESPVVVWGDGSAVRDFLYSRDAAEGVVSALYHGTSGAFVNLGGGKGYSIRELVETLSRFIDFKWRFDRTKPEGFPKRVMDISKAQKVIHWRPMTPLEEGLKQTWDWFVKNQKEYLRKKNYFRE